VRRQGAVAIDGRVVAVKNGGKLLDRTSIGIQMVDHPGACTGEMTTGRHLGRAEVSCGNGALDRQVILEDGEWRVHCPKAMDTEHMYTDVEPVVHDEQTVVICGRDDCVVKCAVGSDKCLYVDVCVVTMPFHFAHEVNELFRQLFVPPFLDHAISAKQFDSFPCFKNLMNVLRREPADETTSPRKNLDQTFVR
jgi:hypothetical protein